MAQPRRKLSDPGLGCKIAVAVTAAGPRPVGLAVEEGCQPVRGNGPVGVPAQLSDLGPVQVAVEADADPSPVADIGRPEEPAGLGGDEFVLGSGRARTPQVREVMIMVAGGPQRDERALPPDEPGRRAVAGPFGHLGQRQADSPQLPGQVRCHWFLPTRLTPGPPVGLWKPTVTGDREAE